MRVMFEAMMKSSAVSVWILPEPDGRERVAIFPSGLPVEKEKEAAGASETSKSKLSAPMAVLLADKAAFTSGSSRRGVGVSSIVFVLFRSLIIICFVVHLFPRFWLEQRTV